MQISGEEMGLTQLNYNVYDCGSKGNTVIPCSVNAKSTYLFIKVQKSFGTIDVAKGGE